MPPRCSTEASDGLNVVEGARFAGIQAAKQTSSLIPLCHPIRIDGVRVDVTVDVHRIEISAITEIVERTGVEMEALTACAVAALTLVTALIEVDPEASVEELTLWHKSGGRSGNWERQGAEGRLTRTPAPAEAARPAEAGEDSPARQASRGRRHLTDRSIDADQRHACAPCLKAAGRVRVLPSPRAASLARAGPPMLRSPSP